jgi:transposase
LLVRVGRPRALIDRHFIPNDRNCPGALAPIDVRPEDFSGQQNRVSIQGFMNGDSQPQPTRDELIALIRTQAAEISALKARIAELERRLGLDSSDSGKPPSSDGLKKPLGVRSSREQSGKRPGGQKGEPLRQVAEADSIVDHFPASCAACGAAVTPAARAGHSARASVIPIPTPNVSMGIASLS